MKTLAQILLNTLIFMATISLSTNSHSQNDYYDTNTGQLTEEDGTQGNFDESEYYENDNTVYDNTIKQYADSTEYRSSTRQNTAYYHAIQNDGYRPNQLSNNPNQPVNQQTTTNTGYGENLFQGDNPNTNPNQNPKPGQNYNPRINPNHNPTFNTNNNELKDFGVQATSQLYSGNFHAPTPTTIPGGRVITTNQLQSMVMNGQKNTLIFDVLDGPQYLPGAIPASQGAAAGNFSDQTQQGMGQFLSQVTRGNKQMAMVFYCQSNYCWMSYNAALRAINMGYQNVYWYRGGIEAWKQQGLFVQYANNSPYNNY